MNKHKYKFLLLLATICFGFFGFKFYDNLFPVFSFNKKIITEYQVQRIAQADIQKLNLTEFSKLKKISYFTCDPNLPYLENLLKTKETDSRKLFEKMDLAYWNIRYFFPEYNKELLLTYSIDGKFIGLNTKIFDNNLNSSLNNNLNFSDFIKFIPDINDFELINTYETINNGLKNKTFTWKLKNSGQNFGDYILEIRTHNNQVINYNRYLNLPEKYRRDFEKKLAFGQIINGICVLTIFIMFIVSIFIIAKNHHSDLLIPLLRIAKYVGLIVGFLTIFSSLNNFKLMLSLYSTNMPLFGYVATLIAGAIPYTLLTATAVYILFVGGSILQKKVFSYKDTIIDYLSSTRFVKSYSTDLFYGYSFGIIWIGCISLFYFIGRIYFGVWSVVDIKSNYIGSFLPFIDVFASALTAGLIEELSFRLMLINIFKKYFRYTWIAIILSAVLWACSHASYAIFPFYVRILELVPLGVLLGYIYVKRNIMTCIMVHMIINMILLSLPLLSTNVFNIINILLLHLLLLIPFAIFFLINKFKIKNQVI